MKTINNKKIGLIAQFFIIGSLASLEINWGASVQMNIVRGIYCAFFLVLFLVAMFDLYVLNKRNTTLKTSGFFRFSRHPGYVFLFMLSLSYCFSETNSLIPIVLLQIILWTALLVASLSQEKLMLQKYGNLAEEYYKKTPRFLFF